MNNKNLTINTKQKKYIGHNCSSDTLDNLAQELYKRIIIPMYIPIFILISMSLILITKESQNFLRTKFLIFIFGFLTIVFSESTLRFIDDSLLENLDLAALPIILILIIYQILIMKLKKI